MRSEMLAAMAKMGCPSGEAITTRWPSAAGTSSGLKFAPMVDDWPTGCRYYKYCIQQVGPHLRQEPPCFMAEAGLTADNGSGHALPPVDLEGTASPVFRPANKYFRHCRKILPVVHRRPSSRAHAKAINAFTNPTHEFLQSGWVPGLRGAGGCLPIRPATARRSCRIPWDEFAQGQARRGTFPRSARPTRIFGFAAMLMAGLDGRQEQARSGPPPSTKDLYGPAAGGTQADPDPSAARCARRWGGP